MPVVIAENEQRTLYSPSDVSYDYDYPDRMNLRPGSELHARIVNEIMDRARDSYNIMSARHTSWSEVDEMATAYIKTDTKESAVIAKDSRKPTSIVVPQTYATLEILLTYMTAALLEAPLFRYEGRSPEDVLGDILLEKVIDQQCYYTKAAMALHTLFRDGFLYGVSAVSPVWCVDYGWTTVGRTNPTSLFNQLLGQSPAREKVAVETMLYEGNKIENIDPYLLLLDPNVPISRVQDSEFVGWISSDSLTGLLKQEQSLDGQMFNVRYLKHIGRKYSILRKSDASGRGVRSGVGDRSWVATGTTSPVDVIYMYVDLIPKDWKMPTEGDGEYPETWLFGVAADQIVVRAAPLNLNHNKKPIACFSPDYDGYSTVPIAKMEMVSMSEYTPRRLKSAKVKADQLVATGAKYVVTSCHNCVDGLSDLIRHYKLDMKVTQLVNLVANALRYTPAGGEIVLSARSQAGALALTVQDNGRGIEPEALPHIFDRFYRGDEARAESDGESGLGLAIAKSIVEAHHGTIAATSVPGHCTTFTVTLPAAGRA